MAKEVRILFLVPYPVRYAPSQRFRVEMYLPELDKAGLHYSFQSFLDEQTWNQLYKGGGKLQKFYGVIKGFARRLVKVLFGLKKIDYVFIHREASPLGPPIFEWLISKVFRKKIIFDFDDAIWIPNTTRENKMISWVKACWKVKYICQWSYKVVGGNEYLCEYARKFNARVVKIPTSVDTVGQHNRIKNQFSEKTIIGWTGSHSTMKFLDQLVPVVKILSQKYPLEFIVISNKHPEFELEGLRYVPWNEQHEVADLLQINIGIMPLDRDPWCEGKCGFKLIQYLSLGIPAVASPVGVNQQIVEQGTNGFLCSTKEEWIQSLSFLIEKADVRESMGKSGREKMEREYSLQSQVKNFLGLFT